MLEKQFGGICPIVINEVTYYLVVRTLAIQFKGTLVKHFSLYQVGVVTHGECETVVHGIQMMLDLHLNGVVL
jgi:hypothetical protein